MKTIIKDPSIKATLLLACVFSFSCRSAPTSNPIAAVEQPSIENQFLGAVAADHQQASDAGKRVLEDGGNAIDAAVATALALGVVNPNSSGMGGGGFAVVYDAQKGKTFAYDFRETAPKQLTPEKFVVDGKVDPSLSKHGGLASGVPGEVLGLETIWKKHGNKNWKEIVLGVAELAKSFKVSGFLESVIAKVISTFPKDGPLQHWAVPNGVALKQGQTTSRPLLVKTLTEIAENGSAGFYQGWVAEDLISANQKAGGVMTLEDLAGFKVIEREPLKGKFFGKNFRTMPMPSSGGVLLLEMLGILEAGKFPLASWGHRTPESLHVLSEVLKHGFADRSRVLGDTQDSNELTDKLLQPSRLASLAKTIKMDGVSPHENYGDKALPEPQAWVDDKGTSHFCVVDSQGNAVALTTTVNGYFGSDVMGPKSGVVLNNQMDDFALKAGVPNMFGLIQSEANLVGPGKKPLSSMTPTLVFEGDKVVGCFGGSGGPRIISNTFQVILNVFAFGLNMEEAVSAPRIHHQWLPNNIVHEEGMTDTVKEGLKAKGHEIKLSTNPTAVQGIVIKDNVPHPASDPRKGGGPSLATAQ